MQNFVEWMKALLIVVLKMFFFYVRVHVICLNEPVGVEKVKEQMMNLYLILRTLYFTLYNKTFLNKICV